MALRPALRVILKMMIGLLIFAGAGLAFVYWYDASGQQPDPDFDARVEHPAYTDDHPKILFDIAHNNFHTPTGRYSPLAKLLESDGYKLIPGEKKFAPQSFDSIAIVLIANALGPENHENLAAFTREEEDAVLDYVNR